MEGEERACARRAGRRRGDRPPSPSARAPPPFPLRKKKKKDLILNINENFTFQKLWDTAKEIFRRKIILLMAYTFLESIIYAT